MYSPLPQDEKMFCSTAAKKDTTYELAVSRPETTINAFPAQILSRPLKTMYMQLLRGLRGAGLQRTHSGITIRYYGCILISNLDPGCLRDQTMRAPCGGGVPSPLSTSCDRTSTTGRRSRGGTRGPRESTGARASSFASPRAFDRVTPSATPRGGGGEDPRGGGGEDPRGRNGLSGSDRLDNERDAEAARRFAGGA